MQESIETKHGGAESPLPEPVCSTLEWGGDEYPVIAKLYNGYSLIGHPNGPAICNGDHISTIDCHSTDTANGVELKRAAQRAYREWSWERVKGTLPLPVFS